MEGEQQDGNSNNPQGPDNRNDDGPEGGQGDGPGEGPNNAPNDGPDQGVGIGVPDPNGRPGLDGPRSTSACMVRGTPGTYRFQVSGEVKIVNPDPNTTKLNKKAITTVVATNVPVARWSSVPKVLVYESFFLTGDQFRFDFSATETTVHVCAFQTTDYQEFTYVHTAGCAQNVVVSRGPGTIKEANKLKLELKNLENTAELLGFSSFVPPDLWPGTARREFTGKVTLPGAAAGTRYLVAFAKNPILETTADEVGNPSALFVTQPDGLFGTAFLSEPNAPQYACALALPPRGVDISKLEFLRAPGCIPITLPVGGSRVDNLVLTLDPQKQYKMTDHEREHFNFLSRCFDG